LYGPKKDLKYQIKLNDVVLDKNDQRSKSTEADTNYRGRLIRGTNFNDEPQAIPDNERTRNADLFSLKKLNSLGPSDYDPNKITKNSPKTVIKLSVLDQS